MPEYPGAPRGPATAEPPLSRPLTDRHVQAVNQFYDTVFKEARAAARWITHDHFSQEDIAASVALKVCADMETEPALATDRGFRRRRLSRHVADEWKNVHRGEHRAVAAAARLAIRMKTDPPPLGLTPDGDFDFNEARRRIDEFVATLSPRMRDVFTLVRTQHYTIEQAAKKLRRPLGTVKSELKRAVDKIRRADGPNRKGGNAQ